MIKTFLTLANFCLLGCAILFCSPEANATHSMGTDLTYTCVGNNQYEVTLTFYRDCNGISAPTTPSVDWTAACGSGSITMQQLSMTEITPSCPGIVGTACNGGNGVYGIEEYVYQGIVSLPAGCTDIVLSFNHCCRNHAITTLNAPGTERIHVESVISDAALCNNSPVFTNKPVPFGCVGQPVFYNHGASDPDGDQLSYSLVPCLDNTGTPVIYGPNMSATNPLSTSNGVSLDPNTGALSFTPDITQVGVLCVLVEEFRNGVKIGEVVRDIQFTAVPCSNNVPTLSGINNTTDFSTTATAGSQLCFDLFSNDVDAGQTTYLSWNNGIAGGSFSSAGTPHAVGSFCWTPTSADVGIHTFTVTVEDDYCPIVGQNTYTYTIEVIDNTPPPCDSIDVTVASTNDVSCSNNDGAATIVASNGVAPYTYQVVNWATGQFFTNTSGVFSNLTPGSYSIWVADANGCTPSCTGHTFTIGGNVTPLTATAVATDVACPSNSTNVVDSSNSDGTITVTATGGTPGYMYSIDGINFQTSDFFGGLAAGTYTVIVLDDNGCSYTVTATVGEPTPLSITVVSSTPATCGQANGSITLTASGGDGVYFYYINGQSQGSNNVFTGLAPGTYTFSVCDMSYCLYDTTITITDVPGFVATATSTSPLCSGDCNGTATVQVDSSVNVTAIQWDNGATTATITDLCAGTYSVVVTDDNGCTSTATVTIVDPAPISTSVASTSDESCLGNDGAATINISGGTAPYNVNLANFSNSTTMANNTGVFSGLNAGQHVVNITDANGCSVHCAEHFTLAGCNSTAPISLGSAGSNSFTPSLLVTPNPASTVVQLAYETQERSTSITVLDGNGKTVYNKSNLASRGSVEIFINNWSNSTYFVVLRGAEGNVVKTKKLIISK